MSCAQTTVVLSASPGQGLEDCGIPCKLTLPSSKHSLYEARIHQIWPFEVLCISQPVDAALLDLQGQLVYNEERTTTPPVVCVQPQLIQSNVVNHTHLHT